MTDMTHFFVAEMNNGSLPRTPLLKPGQTIRTLAHGVYNVTGGKVGIGNLGDGNITRIINMAVNGMGDTEYAVGNQPLNHNFASVLFEIRAAGQQQMSLATMTGPPNVPGYVNGTENWAFINSFRATQNLGVTPHGELRISDELLNGIAS